MCQKISWYLEKVITFLIMKRHKLYYYCCFSMGTQVAKIKKFQKKGCKGTLRWVRLDDDDQDDRNELALFLLGPSDLKGNNFPQVV